MLCFTIESSQWHSSLFQFNFSEHACSLFVETRFKASLIDLYSQQSDVIYVLMGCTVGFALSKADPFNSCPSACFYHAPGSETTRGTMQPPLIFPTCAIAISRSAPTLCSQYIFLPHLCTHGCGWTPK